MERPRIESHSHSISSYGEHTHKIPEHLQNDVRVNVHDGAASMDNFQLSGMYQAGAPIRTLITDGAGDQTIKLEGNRVVIRDSTVGPIDFSETFTGFRKNQTKILTRSNDMSLRKVQVFIADPGRDVPMDISPEDLLLYQGEEKLTRLTDQELFFEIDNIGGMLKEYNTKRTEWQDSEGRTLMPLRIKDLSMSVVTTAQF